MGAQVVEQFETNEQLKVFAPDNSLDLNARLADPNVELAAPLSNATLQTQIPSDYASTVAKEIAKEISVQISGVLKLALAKQNEEDQIPFNEQHAIAELKKLGIEVKQLKTIDQIKDARLQIDNVNQPLIDRIAVTELANASYSYQSHVVNSKFRDFRFNPPNLAATIANSTYGILTLGTGIAGGVAAYLDPALSLQGWGVFVALGGLASVFGSIVTAPIAMGVGSLLSKWSSANDAKQARKNYHKFLETNDPIASEVEHAIHAGAQFIDQSIPEEQRRTKSADIIGAKLTSELDKSSEINEILRKQTNLLYHQQKQQSEDAISVGVLTSAAVSGINLSLDQDHNQSRVSASDLAFLEEYLQSITAGIEPKSDDEVPIYMRDSILKLDSLQPEFRQNVANELLPRISAMRELMADAISTAGI